MAVMVPWSLKQREERVDDYEVRRKEPTVTPVLDPPKRAIRSTMSAAINMDAGAVVVGNDPAEDDELTWLDSNLWAEGIDYERWAPIADPSPGSAFADRLDFLDRPEV